MGSTNIEWADAVWNPIRGCTRVSEGCRNCYAEAVAGRFSGPDQPFHHFAELKFSDATKGGDGRFHGRWTGNVALIESKLKEPLHWRKPRRIFVNSMSDLFHEKLSFRDDIAPVFKVMRAAKQHTFLVLTKRPQRMLEFVQAWCGRFINTYKEPLPNVWLGVSVEDQKTADERIPILLTTPSAVRFVSYEPALEPVDLKLRRFVPSPCEKWPNSEYEVKSGIHWVIVGGESGPHARPFDVAWARSAIEQCKAAGVAAFYKQGGTSNSCPHDRKGGHFGCFPEDLKVREFPRAL